MPPRIRLNYIILGEPNLNNVRTLETDADTTVARLINLLESTHSIDTGQLEKVSMPMKDEAIHEKLRNFTFKTPMGDWTASRKLSSLFTDLSPDDIHLIIQSRGVKAAVMPSESACRFQFLEDRHPEAPSSGAQLQTFKSKQKPATEILCNRPSTSTPPIPLTLLDRIFAQFLDDCENIQTTPEINKFTLRLTDEMSSVYGSDLIRREMLIYFFLQLGIDFETFEAPETGHKINIGITKGQFLVVCGEVRHENANNSDDPYLRATLCYLEQTRSLAANFPLSVLPCLILLCVGPYLSFAGAAWNGRPNIQVLTPAIPLHFHHTDLKLRSTTARYIAAFKSAVESLKNHYEQPYYQNPAGSIPAGVNAIFPYPKSFECGTSKSSKNFLYISQMMQNKLIYHAEVCDTHEKICVKFVQRYSPEAHRICAKIGCAPELLGFEALPGGWFMVVMKELDNHVNLYQSSLTRGRLDEVKHHLRGKLIEMHQQGFVHGDVHDANVMVSSGPGPSLGVMLVDFDWAGRIGEVRYPMNVNRQTIDRPEGTIDHELILAEHDLMMLQVL